jgi:pimeloyl-ACP methyl ester carboxylesterase
MTPYPFPDYQVAGSGDTTVFLLHGAYGSKDYFRDEIAALVQEGLRVVAWDAPGYGISPLPKDLSIEGLAEAAARLVTAVGTRTNIVVGHSMGGIIAPAVCARIPDRVQGLVVSATVASFSQKTDEEKRVFLEERIEPLKRGKPFRETAQAVVDSMFAPTSSGARVQRVKDVALAMSAETFMAAISAIVHYEGVPTLQSLNLPTLLVAGTYDKVGNPASMEKMAGWLKQARFVCIDNAAHYAFAEQQDTFNQHLLHFIRHDVLKGGKQ